MPGSPQLPKEQQEQPAIKKQALKDQKYVSPHKLHVSCVFVVVLLDFLTFP